ncbi:hypothetical protein WMF38_41775 [Sorangium sp. So ce118]
MGVHVILDIDPRGIDEAEWAATYEEALACLLRWRRVARRFQACVPR